MVIISKIALLISYIFILLLTIILLLLIIPFSYSVYLNFYNSNVNGTISIKWLKGFIGVKFILEENKLYHLTLLGQTIATNNIKDRTENIEKKPKKIKKSQKRKNKQRRKIHIEDIEFIELFKVLKEFISKLFEKLKPKKFKLHGIYGFENPTLTGTMSGIISILSSFRIFDISIYPSFIEEVIDAKLEIEGQIRIIDLIILFIATIIKRPIRKLIFRKKEKAII